MMIDNQLYLDVGSYKTLSQGKQKALGVDPAGETEIDGNAPYWRIALEKTWGAHTMEIGTYGLNANTFPGRDKSAGHDRFLDIAVDLQYQWSTTGKDVTISANWINEYQTLDASKLLGLAQNRSNKLWTASLYGSYLIDKTYGFDAQYFKMGGDADPLFYGTATGGPNTDGWRFQLNYLPFNKNGGPKFLTSSSVKFALQYIMYNKFDGAKNNFDGTGRNASDNDTVYLQSWIVF